jgi:hypothetical protein
MLAARGKLHYLNPVKSTSRHSSKLPIDFVAAKFYLTAGSSYHLAGIHFT